MVSRGKAKQNMPKGQAKNTQDCELEDREQGKSQEDSLFGKAVKDAERSLLIFNLDLGQTPTINPATISNKVTSCLLNLLAKKRAWIHTPETPGNSSTTS
jgi:hypothetical protein